MTTTFKTITKESILTQWVHKKKLNLVIVMSDDLDSLISSCLYSYLTGYSIGYFYDFKSLSAINPNDTRERVYIDIAIREGKCIDNHVQRLTLKSKVNNEAINFNSIFEVCRENYYEKFAMSTLIILYATFKGEISLPSSVRGKMIILTIDSGYLGFYKPEYKEAFVHNLKALGLEELLEVLEQHTLQEFEHMKECLNRKIGKKIMMDEFTGELCFTYIEEKKTTIDKHLQAISNVLGFPISLPKSEFKMIQEFHIEYVNANDVSDLMENDKVYSYAFTGKDTLAISYMYNKDLEKLKAGV